MLLWTDDVAVVKVGAYITRFHPLKLQNMGPPQRGLSFGVPLVVDLPEKIAAHLSLRSILRLLHCSEAVSCGRSSCAYDVISAGAPCAMS